MEIFHSDPVLVSDHTKGAFAHFLPIHKYQRIAMFFRDLGGRFYLLQIIPKRTLPQSGCNGRKPLHRYIQRILKNSDINIFCQGDRLAKQIAPILSTSCRIDFCGIVQFDPPQRLFLLHTVNTFQSRPAGRPSLRRSYTGPN